MTLGFYLGQVKLCDTGFESVGQVKPSDTAFVAVGQVKLRDAGFVGGSSQTQWRLVCFTRRLFNNFEKSSCFNNFGI